VTHRRSFALCLSLAIIATTGRAAFGQGDYAAVRDVAVVQTGSALTVSWTPPATPVAQYIVNFFAGDAALVGPSTRIASVGAAGTSTELSLPIPPGTGSGTYTVVITSLNSEFLLIGTSTPVPFTLGAPGCSGPPPPPTGLAGTRVLRTTNIRWNQSPGASSYVVQAGTTELAANLFNGNIGNVLAVGSDALDPSLPLFVRVLAVNDCGASQPTADLNLTGSGSLICVPDANTMCLFSGRFTTKLEWVRDPIALPAFATVTRRFNDGGGFSFTPIAAGEDLFVRIENRCASTGSYVVFFDNRSGFPASTGFQLFVGDNQASVSRQYLHAPGTPFVSFQDSQSFRGCP
jgi:hypothetical protein